MSKIFLHTAYGPDSRPPMAIFELLDYIVNEVSAAAVRRHPLSCHLCAL